MKLRISYEEAKSEMNKFRKIKEDKGSSNTVSFIVIIFFVMIMLISFIDVSVYFNVKNEMRSAAENGARNVALYGGASENALRGVRSATPAEEIVENSIFTKYGGTGSKVPVIEPMGVECGPGVTSAAGDDVWCEVTYKYNGLAGKFGMFQLGGSNIVKVKGASVSEVGHK